MLFNIWIPVLFILYFFNNFNYIKKIQLSSKSVFSLIWIYLILWVSTYLAIIPNLALFWWTDKWHGFILLNNLFLLFILFFHYFSEKKSRYIFKILLYSTVILSLVWIKEYYLPSYNYWDLWNRLISTLWHPNYVSAILLMIIPYNYSLLKNNGWIDKYIVWIILILLLYTLLLTKSIIAIFLVIIYLIYEIYYKNKLNYYTVIIGIFLLIFSIWMLLLFKSVWVISYLPEKLNSLISRFYIWETTIKIIFSDIKIFFFWIGWDNLKLLFDNYKSTELYLYENIWFNADRPHNIFLNIWIHYWIFLLLFSLFWFYKLISNFYKNSNWYNISLFLVVIFWCFNFPNIIWYLYFIIILTYSLIIKNWDKWDNVKCLHNKLKKYKSLLMNIIILFSLIVSIIWWYFSYNQYKSQALISQDKYSQAINIFPYYWEYHYNNFDLSNWLIVDNNFYSEKYYLYKVYFSLKKIPECHELVKNYPSIENYFYCGQLIENKFRFHKADFFYNKWLEKMPDIWNNNNKYLNSFPWKYIINTDRIMHIKYSNIKEILRKLEVNKMK
jgi:hypothetical protein